MNRKCIYTSVFNKDKIHDILKEPSIKTEGWGYICFTNDRSLSSDIWDIRIFDDYDESLSPVINNRRLKMLEHNYMDRRYDQSILMLKLK